MDRRQVGSNRRDRVSWNHFRFPCDPGSKAKVIRWTTSPAYRLLDPVSSDSDRIRQATSVYIAFENTEVGW
jgi:hypothetical protein